MFCSFTSLWKKCIVIISILSLYLFIGSRIAYPQFSELEINKEIEELFFKRAQRARVSASSRIQRIKCATHIIRRAKSYSHLLRPENRFILYRPTDEYDVDYYGRNVEVWTYDTPEGHYKIHYTEAFDADSAVIDSDGVKDTIPEYVIRFGNYFEHTYLHEITHMGYDPPEPDGNKGGDGRFDIYILKISAYGYTDIDEDNFPYIVINNNYSKLDINFDPESDEIGNMKITAAHEFFHAVQYKYDGWPDENMWWEENTAVWMEDEVFDYINGYLHYLGHKYDDLNNNLQWDAGETWYEIDGTIGDIYHKKEDTWFECPEKSLDSSNNGFNTLYMYGGCIWAKYLSEKYGPDIIRHIFTKCSPDVLALPAISSTLKEYGSDLKNEFAEFRIKVLLRDFEEGEYYPLVWHAGNYSITSSNPLVVNEDEMSGWVLNHLSCYYYGIEAREEENQLIVEFNGEDGSEFGLSVVLFRQDGDFDTAKIISIDDFNDYPTQKSSLTIDFFGRNSLYPRLTLIPMNLSLSQNYRSFQITLTLKDMPDNKHLMRLGQGINLISIPLILSDNEYTSYDFIQNFINNEFVGLVGYDNAQRKWETNYLRDQIDGDPFLITPDQGYIVYINQESNLVILEGEPVLEPAPIILYPGHNILSPLSFNNELLCSYSMFTSTTDHDQPVAISHYHSKSGKWETSYLFFNSYSGPNFDIHPNDGYIIDLKP
ncbi:MAG: MXAN_6640 family putative metalloprotease [bacterium]